MTKKIKVALLSKACVTRVYRSKLDEIVKQSDVDLTVIVPPEWRDERGTLPFEVTENAGYDIRVEPIAFNGSYHCHFYPGLRRRLYEIDPDVLHIDEEPYNFATGHAMWVARGHRCKTLFFSWQNINKHYPWPFSAIESSVMRKVDAAIFGSISSLKVFEDKGYRGISEVIPQFGVDTEVYRMPTNAEHNGSSLNIGYIGRLVYEKGVDLLIHVMTRMPKDVRLNVYGSGPELSALRELIDSLQIQDRVLIAPWMESDKIPSLLHTFDVLVLPSRTTASWKEQFGRVLIEAMASGVPVIGSSCGEIPHVIGDAGFVFEENDSFALAEALMRLYSDISLRSQLAQKGRKRVLTHFTQASVASRTAKLYKSLAHNS
ncbi:MAG: glycosyl transferase family 1 [Chloroflexi bacterium]|nr:glycosyl transferase family 1 [Chloroflexota bacterium]|tara:strand:- start:828 stop:1949 length:1122 start_codon:yes stop_codon:yes gene_type:complete